jgi:hypothetical protein
MKSLWQRNKLMKKPQKHEIHVMVTKDHLRTTAKRCSTGRELSGLDLHLKKETNIYM